MKRRWSFLKLPDWLIYLLVAALIVWIATGRRENAVAPLPPPPVPGEAAAPLSPDSPFSAGSVRAPVGNGSVSGTAFSISDRGVWLTAAHVVRACRRVVLMVAEERAVEARVEFDEEADVAILTTTGGAPALPVYSDRTIRDGVRGYHPGFPRGGPGEVTSRFAGRTTLPAERRGETTRSVLAWAETGRTEGLEGALYGLSGSPVMDAMGTVVGVTIGEAPRRGRIYSTGPDVITRILAERTLAPAPAARTELTTVENYFRVADGLRRSLSVTEVLCLKR